MTRPELGLLAALRPRHGESGSAGLYHYQSTNRLRGRGELWDHLFLRLLPRNCHGRSGLYAKYRGGYRKKLEREQTDLIQALNHDLAASPAAPDAVDGVIKSHELAFRMQNTVPPLLDISKEPQKVLECLYRFKPGLEGSFVRQCLMARRLSEAGVRFVEIRQPGWDHHTNLHDGLIEQSRRVDQPTSALLADLAQRGLLEDALVLFGSEFGRLPTSQGADGHDHNITGYSVFLTGAGVKKGLSYSATDEIGMAAVEGRMHINDLHATLLALMGIDHERLTYRYAGRGLPSYQCSRGDSTANFCLSGLGGCSEERVLSTAIWALRKCSSASLMMAFWYI